ncbi:MAG: LysR substrate-binding domain-containing protein [Betaproteobacteria bacterium]
MLKYLDLALLQAFSAVVDSGSFTRAAQYLCRTQSAVSMQLRKLEDLTGHQLLHRDSRNIKLTEEGEVLLGYARRMIRLNEEALVALDQPHAQGHVRLGMPDDYAHQFLPGVLAHFAHAYPRVQLEVIGALSGDLLNRVEAGELDVALITRQPKRRRGQVLRTERLVWTGSRQHLAYEASPLPLALFPEGCVFREHALAALDAAQIPWRIAYTSQSFAGGKLAVSGGLALTVVAQSMVPPEWRVLGAEHALPRLPEIEIALHRAPGTLSPAVALLEAQLVAAVQTETGQAPTDGPC